MEEPLHRVLARVAEQRVTVGLKAGDAIEPPEFTGALRKECSRFVRFASHKTALRDRVESFIGRVIDRHKTGRSG